MSSFLAAGALHRPGERLFVLSAPSSRQAGRQFMLDFGLCLLAGVLAVGFDRLVLGIYLTSGLAFLVGYLAFGFFIAMDMALSRERAVIADAIDSASVAEPPRRLYSLTRRFVWVALGTVLLIVAILSLVIARDMVWLSTIGQSGLSDQHALWSVIKELVFIMSVLLVMVVNLIFSYSGNLKLLFENETVVLEGVSNGDLSRMVPVATHDEFGTIAVYTNIMIEGLRHRIQLIASLKMAEEVQRNLLPRHPPKFDRTDISGVSLYCDAVGGDYYDYLEIPGNRLGIVVTDASGHGVGAALHMASARAFLRSGIQRYRGPSRLLNEINHFLVCDSIETGRFITLFFLEINPDEKMLSWVRAGHDPAMLYDPVKDSFEKMDGKGMALGVMQEVAYPESVRENWTEGSIILISTDGVRETRNKAGEMFGVERLQEIIRSHADRTAGDIQKEIIASLQGFRGNAPQEDDVTLLVIKLL